ncbi:HipA family kinase [Belliella pelovolcani]|uniref:HipA-like kinase domain-containing protein n=1 Tax=Belliella pelovolcani TaxID=529505 RepID=A0A1N7KVK0_9BACT|nr:HipA family kinase [Belliella pelovolcani]SIS65516.1 hypothetical protein SAMN05421761_102372 [Belliella pelovolcani]
MDRLYSIEEVNKRYETAGSRPLLIHASDMEFYICKYPYHWQDSKLLNEYLAYNFAKIWGLPIPEMKLIDLKREHLPAQMLGMQLNYISIEVPLISSLKIQGITELIDEIAQGYTSNVISKFDKHLLLKIALFDIWLSNEDRNTGNMNLLINLDSNILKPILIDNEKIFNSGSLFRPLLEITYEDSLFYTYLFRKVFGSRNRRNIKLIHEIEASLQPLCSLCFSQLSQIVEQIPYEWGYDRNQVQESLNENLFSEEWMGRVRQTYLQFAGLMYQRP